MFTGLIQALGTVESFTRSQGGARLGIRAASLRDLVRGESIAINGVCLTVIPDGDVLTADLSSETLAKSSLGQLARGSLVNLERALTLADRLGGHLVQGHVDAVGRVVSQKRDGGFAVYRWSFPANAEGLIVEKGSIAVDGVSLTVVEPNESEFGAALIPETLERTNLRNSKVGDEVNLEFDLMAKFARKLLAPYMRTRSD